MTQPLEIRVRRGSPNEIDVAWALRAEATAASGFAVGSSASSLARFAKRFSLPETIPFFADCSGESVGVVVLCQAFSDSEFRIGVDGRAHISTVSVKSDYWGQGIGHRLMVEALNEARRAHYRDVQLWVHCSNARAIRLYERFGFADTNDERSDDYGKPMHRYLLALNKKSG